MRDPHPSLSLARERGQNGKLPKSRYTLADVLVALREQYRTGDVIGLSGKPYINRTELFGDVADMWCLPLDNLDKQDSKTIDWLYGLFVHEFRGD